MMPTHRLNSALSGGAVMRSINAGRTMSGSIRSSYVSNANPIAAMMQINHWTDDIRCVRLTILVASVHAPREESTVRKIDIFTHFFPQAYFQKMLELAPMQKDMGKRVRNI